MNLTTLLKLELKNFLAGRAVAVAFVCLLAASFYAMYHGKNVIEKQRAIIAQIPAFQAEHVEKQLALSDDLGNVLYYLRFSTVHQPSSWAAFSIGQRDVNPYNIKVRMLSLEGQLYDSEMSNPVNLLFGNFDLAFVFVFLFPLVIIAFCHNLISADRESGVWNLLCSQPVSASKIIAVRIFLRFAVVVVFAFAIAAAGCFYLESTFDARFIYVCLLISAYLAFWFALAAFVISFQKSSVFNALGLLGAWILLTILAPALLNLVISTLFPVSESFEVTVRQREGYHQKWDKPKAETMTKFYEKYPEYKAFPVPEDKFSWGWYYAMQNAGDEESADATARYMQKLNLRDTWTNRAAIFLPTVNAQLDFNALAKNDLQSHLAYLDAVRKYHEKIRTTFYPAIFRNEKVKKEMIHGIEIEEFKDDETPVRFPQGVFTMIFISAIFAVFAFFNFNNRKML